MSFLIDTLVKDIASLTYHDVVRRKLITPLVVFVSFLLSFGVARLIAYSFPKINFIIGLYHVHHFYYGIALLVASNWIALITNRQRPLLVAAALFGVGLGIIADEVGLLLTCTSPLTLQCDYNARISIDIFIIIVAAFLSVLYFIPFAHRTIRLTYRTIAALLAKIKK